MKKTVKLIAMIAMLIFVFTSLAFASAETQITLDGEKINVGETAPVVENGIVFIPLRAVFEAIGADVYWENETRTIIASCGEKKVVSQIDNTSLFINSEEVFEMPAAPYIKNDRTLIASEALNKAFGYNVVYNEAEDVIEIAK